MRQPFTTMRDIVRAFANAMNLIDPEVENHHEKVAYIAYSLADAMGFSQQEKKMAFYGAILHDVGSVISQNHPSLAELEMKPGELAQTGAAILRCSPVTSFLSDIVHSSQSPWSRLRGLPGRLNRTLLVSQIIHLADAVSLLLREDKSVLNQVADIRQCIYQAGEKEFHPSVLAAFDEICGREAFWMDVLYRPQYFVEQLTEEKPLSLEDTVQLTEFMSRIIDFRSPFTAMHSAGVSATAESLARLMGMSEEECRMMYIAGNLHDIGKLKTPKEILEKPGKLTDEEFNVMKEHAYYSFILLDGVRGFEQITRWAALHHEKLNGTGYPFKMSGKDIPLGARIMAVADVFSAITEDRPYRKGMAKEKAVAVLREDAAKGALSQDIVDLLIAHYDEINAERAARSAAASKRYQESLKQA